MRVHTAEEKKGKRVFNWRSKFNGWYALYKWKGSFFKSIIIELVAALMFGIVLVHLCRCFSFAFKLNANTVVIVRVGPFFFFVFIHRQFYFNVPKFVDSFPIFYGSMVAKMASTNKHIFLILPKMAIIERLRFRAFIFFFFILNYDIFPSYWTRTRVGGGGVNKQIASPIHSHAANT